MGGVELRFLLFILRSLLPTWNNNRVNWFLSFLAAPNRLKYREYNPSSKSIYVFRFFLLCKRHSMSLHTQSNIMLYTTHSHNDLSHNNRNTGGLCCFKYEWVYLLLASVHDDTRRETQFLKAYANHTMLTPPQRAVHLVMFKISINLCWSRSEKTQPPTQR